MILAGMPPKGGARVNQVGKMVLDGSKLSIRLGYAPEVISRGEPINVSLDDADVLIRKLARRLCGNWYYRRLLKKLGFTEKKVIVKEISAEEKEPEYVEQEKMI